jgi:DNA/RNA endonuclease YhcR with UshA esterase domain
MTACPSCGRPVPDGPACPHCGAALHQRLPLRLLRVAALAVALGGVFILLLGARGAPTPRISIGRLGAAQNLAYVEISGRVSAPVQYTPQTQTLSFRVDDGTGELLVSAFRAASAALVAAGRLPAVGDWVTLSGTARLRDDFASLTLNLPETLVIERPTPRPVTLGALHAGLALQPVTVVGRIVNQRTPYPGLTLITLQDGTGQIDVSLDETTRALTGDPPRFAPSDVVRVSGVVTLFRETPQITLTTSRALEVLPPDTPLASAATPDSVTAIAAVQAGAPATVEGVVTVVASYSGGFKFTLADDTGALTLLLRESVYADLAGVGGLRRGARVRAGGPTHMFEGTLELTPDAADAVTVLSPAPSAAASVPMASLSLASVNQTVTVAGTITLVDEFDENTRVTVSDDTDSVVVLLWSNVLAYVPAAERLTVGGRVRVTGRVTQYQGALEVVPQIGFDVEVQ